jgi:hypothetical protein
MKRKKIWPMVVPQRVPGGTSVLSPLKPKPPLSKKD